MSRDPHEDLDARIRRAWPIDGDTTSSPPGAARRLRTRIDERIATDTSHVRATAHRPSTPRGRHVATVLAAVVVAASVLALGGLLAGRLGSQDRTDGVEFAEKPAPAATDGPTARVPPDPETHVRTAVAATRRELGDLTVTKVTHEWINLAERNFPDVDTFAERTTPFVESRSIEAANGDWSFTDKWDITGESVQSRSRDGCVSFADCSEPVGAMRFVGDQYYERAYGERAWERVIADGHRGPSQVLRNGIALEGTGFLTRRALLEVFEDHGGGWTAVPGSATDRTRYRATDADEARRLIVGLAHGKTVPRAEDGSWAGPRPAVITVEVWIDGASGLVERVRTEMRSTRDITEDTTLLRQDISFTYGGMPAVAAPEQATDVAFDEWCARDRNARWCG